MSNVDVPKSSKDLQQAKRLKFLEFLLMFRGWFTRQDLIDEFKVAPAGATRDIAEYRSMTSADGSDSPNVGFDDSAKKYVRKDSFVTSDPIKFDSGISILKRAKNKGGMGSCAPVPIESPDRLSSPDVEVLAALTTSIANNSCLKVKYGSLNTGDKERLIAPHSLFESETSWYVRAFCFRSSEFRTFKLSRFSSISREMQSVTDGANPINDDQWLRWVNLILEPHHAQQNQEVIAREYGMKEIIKGEAVVSNCGLEVKVRAAVCGFWLQHWNVDCSQNGDLGEQDLRYQLRLVNPETLYDVQSAKLAPGRS